VLFEGLQKGEELGLGFVGEGHGWWVRLGVDEGFAVAIETGRIERLRKNECLRASQQDFQVFEYFESITGLAWFYVIF